MKQSVFSFARKAVTAGMDAEQSRHRHFSRVHVLLVLGISAVVSFLFPHVGLFKQMELDILDLRFKQRPMIAMSPRLGTVDIDSTTIDHAGGWPISRKLYAEALRVLHRYDASLVSFDIFFPDPSSLIAPQEQMNRAVQMAADGGQAEALRLLLGRLAQDPDGDFAAALRETDFAVLAQTFTCSKPVLFPDLEAIQSLTRSALRHAGDRQREAITMAKAYSLPYVADGDREIGLARAFAVEPPVPELLRQATGLGFAQAVQDADGTMRKYPLFILYEGRLYPSIALMGIALLTHVPLSDLKVFPGRYILVPGARWRNRAGQDVVADIRIPVDRYLRMRVNWAGDYLDTFTHIPASALLRFRAEDLIRERLRVYRERANDLLEEGYPLAVQEVVDRRLLGETDAQVIAMDLMLAQLAETAQADPSSTRDDFIRGYAPDDSDPDTRKTVGAVWDQVRDNGRILEMLRKSPDMPYGDLKQALNIGDDRDREQQNATEFLRFIIRRGKDAEQWRPLYFFPPVKVAYEGSTRKTRLSPLDLADKILYLGLTAPGTHDYGPMPFSPVYPRVGLHVNAANTILERHFIHEIPDTLIFLLALVCALPVAYLAARLHPVIGLGFVVLLTTVYLQIGGLAFNRAGVWLPTMQLVVTVVATYLAVALHNVLREQQARRKMQGAFSTYVTPSIVRQVLRDPGMLRLGGQRRTMTVFFSDIAGFTSVSERSTPEELVVILNEYFDAMTGIIFKHEGTLDKYEGDGIMAFWNAPADQDDHAYRACCAAIDCVRDLKTVLFPKWQAAGKPLLSTRIGINTGSMAVGNMGSSTRMTYTVIGDAVNLASRLESANKEYGTHIMISEYTLSLVKDRIAVRELDLLAVKGRNAPLRVYEVLARAGELDPDMNKLLDAYNRALDHYRGRRWQEAVEAFGAAVELHRDDGPSKTYLARCRKYLASPPPPDWNGVWTLTTK